MASLASYASSASFAIFLITLFFSLSRYSDDAVHLTPLTFAASCTKLHVLDFLKRIYDLLCDDLPVLSGDHYFMLLESAVFLRFQGLEPPMVHMRVILRILAEHEVIEDHLAPVVSTI